LEQEEIKNQLQTFKVNKKSEKMVNKKINNELMKKEEDKKNEIEFDLWPEINKEYVKDFDSGDNEDFENDIELHI
jgi:hypothetical protein